MTLQNVIVVQLTGFEVATALGCLKYIYDTKNLGPEVKYLESLIHKLEKVRDE